MEWLWDVRRQATGRSQNLILDMATLGERGHF